MPGHEVYTITAEQLDEWKKSAEPLEKQWADNVKKAGGDPDAIMKELKQSLAQIQGGVLTGERMSSAGRSAIRDDTGGGEDVRRRRQPWGAASGEAARACVAIADRFIDRSS